MKYEIIYSKNKHAYVRVMPDMSLKLTIPSRKLKDKELENILLEKWKLLLQKFENKISKKTEYITKDHVIIFWEKVLISNLPSELNNYLKEKLYFESYNLLEKCSKELNIPFQKLTIKSLKSKWGSCSWDNNITINLKLIHLPVHFLEYVVIHESCHLKEKNHSERFWSLVQKYFPEYKKVRSGLKKILI